MPVAVFLSVVVIVILFVVSNTGYILHVLMKFLAAISVTQDEEEAQASEVLKVDCIACVVALEDRDFNRFLCGVLIQCFIIYTSTSWCINTDFSMIYDLSKIQTAD